MSFIEIYGTTVILPELKATDLIENWGTDDATLQFWRREELPDYFELVEYDKEGNALLNQKQRDYANEEVRRCKQGFWFYNNGIATYITGKHYFYLKWWKLEDDIYPEYRNTDRRYFLYLNHWENVMWCLGILRGKKRREGATSQGASNLIYECIFFKNSFCGLTSKTQTDAKTAFTNMVSFGYRQLPVFLKPKQLNNKDSVTELVFAHKSNTVTGGYGSAIDKDTGHRSKVDFRAPSKNAYDSGRLSRGLFDEGGKFPVEVPFSEFLAIVSKTMVKGAKRVGFMECPSTVNEMTKGGGAEYKKSWDAADQFKGDRTPNRLVRYFSPAYDGFVGFIDQYGMSVIDAPTEQQYKYLTENFVGSGDLTGEDIRLGAREYLLSVRKSKEGVALEEEIRMNPFNEREMFLSAGVQCLFAAHATDLRDREQWLGYNENIERGDLIWKDGDRYYKEAIDELTGDVKKKVGKLIWIPNENGKYEKVKGWIPKEANNVFINPVGSFQPNGSYAVKIGCDPFKYDKTKNNRRSNCAGYAYQMEDILDKDSPYNDMFTMRIVGRPPTTDLQYDLMLKMAWYCGCKVLFERNVDGWKKYFAVEKCSGFLEWLPGEVEPGVYANPETTQLLCDLTEAYIDKHLDKVYFSSLIGDKSGWLGFMVEDTEAFDDVMGAGYALLSAKVKRYIRPSERLDINNLMPQRKAS